MMLVMVAVLGMVVRRVGDGSNGDGRDGNGAGVITVMVKVAVLKEVVVATVAKLVAMMATTATIR